MVNLQQLFQGTPKTLTSFSPEFSIQLYEVAPNLLVDSVIIVSQPLEDGYINAVQFLIREGLEGDEQVLKIDMIGKGSVKTNTILERASIHCQTVDDNWVLGAKYMAISCLRNMTTIAVR